MNAPVAAPAAGAPVAPPAAPDAIASRVTAAPAEAPIDAAPRTAVLALPVAAPTEPFLALDADHVAPVASVFPRSDAAEQRPTSRREARTARGAEPVAPARGRRSAPAVTAPAAPASAVTAPASAAGASAPRRLSRHLATKGMATLVIMMVALIAVATSTPANALLSAADVQAAAVAAKAAELGPEQTVAVGGAVGEIAVQRDGYDTASVAQVAAESGIRLENSFVNNPNGTVQWPFLVGVHVGDRFGYRNCAGCSSNHRGQDFNPGLGAPIQSIADGVVTHAEDGEGSLGVNMMIEHVVNGETITSVYAHMQHGTMKYAVGDTVAVGDVIGNTGNTGMSTGPHLHFEIRLGDKTGEWTDPLEWLYANTN